jgi:hypothetical protein
MSISTKADHPYSKLAIDPSAAPSPQHTPAPAYAPVKTFSVDYQSGEKTADSTDTANGPLDGESVGDGSQTPPVTKGFCTDYGTRINCVGEMGGEAIEIVHQNGAQITIRPDGTVHIIANGKKGAAIYSSVGDGVLAAPRGKVIIQGADLKIESKGDLQLVAHGNIRMEGRDIITNARGSMTTKVNGRSITNIGSDNNLTVGGAYRQTVAGDIRMQTPNKIETDSNSTNIKTTKDIELNATQSLLMKAVGPSVFSTKGKLSVKSESDVFFNSSSGSAWISGATAVGVEGTDGVWMKGKQIVQSAKDGSITMDATTSVDISTKDMRLSASDSFNTYSQTTYLNSDGEFNIDADGAMDLRGSTIDLNKGAPAAVSPKPIETTSPSKAKAPDTPKAAEYPGAREIIGSIITRLDAPEFPFNAYEISANEMATYKNESQQPDQKAEQIASQNVGAGSRTAPGDEIGSAYVDDSQNTYVAEETPYPAVESTTGTNQWSETVQYFPGQEDIPKNDPDQAKEIIKNIQHLCHNVLYKLNKALSDSVSFSFSRGYSPKTSSSDDSAHTKGLAVDIISSTGNNAEMAEIAAWIAQNTAYDLVRLEMDEEDNFRVHVEAAPPGSKGRRLKQTCPDKECSAPIDDLIYKDTTKELEEQSLEGNKQIYDRVPQGE